jgi:DNA polymerase-4
MKWLFIDMNSYFASVEQHFRPELRWRAVAVVPVESDFTSVIASSYEAKRCGVKTGTRVGDAKRMCPGIELVRARPKIYVQVHHAILRSVDKCAPVH